MSKSSDQPVSEDVGDDVFVHLTVRGGPTSADADMFIDRNGCPAERKWLAGQQVIVHYDDLPESDFTVVDGIRCTTALRTVIDLAAGLDDEHLEQMVEDALRRQLFTVAEALARLAQPDMWQRPGAVRLRRLMEAM